MPIHSRLSIIVVCLLAVVAASGSYVRAGGDPTKSGPKIGSDAPNFSLKDQDGKDRELADLRKDGQVALVFYRSVVW